MLYFVITGLPTSMLATRLARLKAEINNALADVQKRLAWDAGIIFPSYSEDKVDSRLGEKISLRITIIGNEAPPELVLQDLAQTLGDAVQKNFPNALVGSVSEWVNPGGIYIPPK